MFIQYILGPANSGLKGEWKSFVSMWIIRFEVRDIIYPTDQMPLPERHCWVRHKVIPATLFVAMTTKHLEPLLELR